MSYTLATLRAELAKTLNSYIAGTATGGSTTTVIDTNLLDSGQYADDHFIGADIYINDTTDDAAPEGEARYCTDFAQSTGTLTVGKAFSVAPEASDTYEIYLNTTVEELNQALMWAVKDWRFVSSDDLVSTSAEYTVTASHLSGADQIIGVWTRSASDTQSNYERVTNYKLWDNAGVITIEFEDASDLDSTLYVRVEYLADFTQLKTSGSFVDTASVGGDLYQHILNARKYYFERRMQQAAGADRDWYASMVRYTIEELQRLDTDTQRPASQAKQENFGQDVDFHRYQGRSWWLS